MNIKFTEKFTSGFVPVGITILGAKGSSFPTIHRTVLDARGTDFQTWGAWAMTPRMSLIDSRGGSESLVTNHRALPPPWLISSTVYDRPGQRTIENPIKNIGTPLKRWASSLRKYSVSRTWWAPLVRPNAAPIAFILGSEHVFPYPRWSKAKTWMPRAAQMGKTSTYLPPNYFHKNQ